jgi:cation transport regulator
LEYIHSKPEVQGLRRKEAGMPYDTVSELPDSIKDNLPKHAQEIFMKAYNSAWEQYDKPSERRGKSTREATARRVAWAAVKKKYEKSESTGKWKSKE